LSRCLLQGLIGHKLQIFMYKRYAYFASFSGSSCSGLSGRLLMHNRRAVLYSSERWHFSTVLGVLLLNNGGMM
jgi:uncharacterized membrane protein YjjB (DUF3815 family)